MVRHDIRRQNYKVEGRLVVSFCVNHSIETDPTIQQPVYTWSLLSRFFTSQGPCRANLHEWVLTRSRGQRQTMNHIVGTCPLTQFEGGQVDSVYSTKWMMTLSYGWNLQWLQHSQSEKSISNYKHDSHITWKVHKSPGKTVWVLEFCIKLQCTNTVGLGDRKCISPLN